MRWKLLAAACMIASAHSLLGSVWSSSDWALTSEDNVGFGYDGNLYDRKGGAGDGYALVVPNLTLKRISSFTDLSASLSVHSYTFFTIRDLDSLNPSLDVTLRYPYDENAYPTESAHLVAERTTEANAEVGGRLRLDNFDAGWEGNVASTEKTILQARLDAHEVDYLTLGFNDNQYLAGGTTLAYIFSERLDLGVGYDYRYSVSRPKAQGVESSDFKQSLYTFRGRGDFLPKLSGTFFVGLADTAYSGATHRSDLDLEGEFDLVWQATERGKLTLKVSRQNYFSPDGYAYIPASVGPEWTQELKGGYSATVGVDVQHILYRFAQTSRNDNAWGGYLRVKYTVNERFALTFDAAYSKQSSPEAIVNYQRAAFFGNLECKF